MSSLFSFLKYCEPIWYFNKIPKNSHHSPFLNFHALNDDERGLISIDNAYSSKAGVLSDAAFQAIQRGVIPQKDSQLLDIDQDSNSIALSDKYRFLKKYYGRMRVYYVLVIRLLMFHNPISEIKGFVQAGNPTRNDVSKPHAPLPDFTGFHSEIADRCPLVSVIIPTLNRYEYLKDAINDVLNQSYKNIEILVVDQSDNPNPAFYQTFSAKVRHYFQKEKGQWLSRNYAINRSKGPLILFFDDDSRVGSNWILNHIKALDYFCADISAGVSLSKTGGRIPKNYRYFRLADQFDSGNAMVKREVFHTVGLFDRKYDKMRMGDGEFGMRTYLAGFKSISNPLAKRIHLKVSTGGLRQMKSWDAFRSKWNHPRPVPSVLYYYKTYFSKEYVFHGLFWGIMPSLIPYSLKHKKYLIPLSACLMVFLFPLIVYQVLLSHKISGELLRAPSKIDYMKH